MAATTRGAKRKGTPKRQKGKVFGHECPRVFTPPLRPLVDVVFDDDGNLLSPATTAGFGAIAFAEFLHDELKDTPLAELAPSLLPWQRWFLLHALELNPDGTFRFRTVLLWVARQNGKTFLAVLLALWRMYIDGDAEVLGVAQKLAVAQEVWAKAQEILRAIPDLAAEFDKASNINGDLWFKLTGRQRYRVDSADGGGRGFTFTLVLFDELMKQKTWKPWSAISKTTNAKARGQLIAFSNAGGIEAIVQRSLHQKAMAELEKSNPASIGLFWWSPPENAPADSPETWAFSNPSMGYLPMQAGLESNYATDPAPVFETEVLNLFPTGSTGGPFQRGRWADARDPLSKRAPDAPVYICIEVSHDRTFAHIGFATRRQDGLAHVGIMKSRAGTDWVVPWLQSPDRTFTPAGITFQTRGAPVSSMVGEFDQAKLEVTEWGGPDLGRATGLILDAVNLGKLKRRDQPVLDVAATSAVMKKLTDIYVIDRTNSPGDASPLAAVTGAYWLLLNPPPAAPTPRIRTIGG